MSFINLDNYKKLLVSDENPDLSSVFKIGDTVDSETVKYICGESSLDGLYLVQKNSIFCYAADSLGEVHSCHITFSKDNSFWVFRGACFSGSIINRSDRFEHASQTIGEYCVDKFNNDYIHAVKKLYSDVLKGKDGTNLSVIDDYMTFDAYSMVGFLISKYGDDVSGVFKKYGKELCKDELYDGVFEILEHSDDIYTGKILNLSSVAEMNPDKLLDNKIVDAAERSNGGKDLKENKVLERDIID